MKENMNVFKFLILFFLIQFSYSQTILTGKITDSIRNPIPYCNVLIQETDSRSSILAYTYSDEKGNYKITLKKAGYFNIVVSALGFEKKIIPITLTETSNEITNNITLKEKTLELNEVIIKANPPISIKKDTIIFKSSSFTDGTEQTVEDLLKKIPGLNIDSEGNIKVGNQEIEKLMVDGDDLFEKGYKTLSKNMPAYPIKEVELLLNFSNNSLLKGIENSNKVALNLQLDEKFKRIWFGNIQPAIGNDGFYEFKGSLMNFGKMNKYFFLTNFNTIGNDATGDIDNLIRPYQIDEYASTGDNQTIRNLMSLSSTSLSFKKSRTNFNNAKLVSLNSVFNPTERLKIKTLGFFNWDETNFFKNSLESINTNESNFTNTENYNLKNSHKVIFGKINVNYNITKAETLELATKFNNADSNDSSNLIFNNNSTIESLEDNNKLFDQKIIYTSKLDDKKVILFTGRFIDERTPQNYNINQFFYQDLFQNTNNIDNIIQSVKNEMQFLGVNAHLLRRDKNDNLFEFQFGNEFRKDKLKSNLNLLDGETLIDSPIGFQNNTTYSVNDLYLKSKYHFKIKNLTIIGRLNAHQLFNYLNTSQITSSEKPFFINPSFGLDWKINEKNKMSSTYTHNTTNAKILDVYGDFALTGFRSFSKGTGELNQLEASGLNFNYQFSNWTKRFFAGTNMYYVKNHSFFSTNSIIEPNFTTTEKILIKNRTYLSINSKIDYYFKPLKSNLKLDFGFSSSEFENIINNSDLRKIKSITYDYGIEFRSGFKGLFNFHLGTKWTNSKVKTIINNSFTNIMSFLDLTFVPNKKINLQFQSERYYFGNLDNDNTYYFVDMFANYKLIEDKLTIGLIGKNFTNTKNFTNLSISDIGTSTTEFRLLPRQILLKLDYRF